MGKEMFGFPPQTPKRLSLSLSLCLDVVFVPDCDNNNIAFCTCAKNVLFFIRVYEDLALFVAQKSRSTVQRSFFTDTAFMVV